MSRWRTASVRTSVPTPLMVGILYLRQAFNESDESLLERWGEPPYWQYCCGFTAMQHEAPIHQTPLLKWRNLAQN
ncbi:MAG TPA: transposase [Planctomicrobium sp.]|nr:transposase [Planctomicrobium sp.]